MLRKLLSYSLVLPTLVLAQPGTLDPTFGTGGIAVSELSFYDDEVHAVVVQPDGKTIGVGWTDDGSTVTAFVQRRLDNGAPDPAFGTGGVAYSFGAGEQRYAYAVDLQSTGNIVVAGLVYDASFDGNALLMRYLPDGTPDPSFGTGGSISLDYGAAFGFQSAWAMQVMDDDRIVLVGEEGENGIACVRLSADGVLDASFGTNGLALTGIPYSTGLCMKVQDNGSVTVGGYRVDGNSESDWLLARFDPTGVLDAGFGNAGVSIMDVGGTDFEFMRGLDILSDERIAVCGYRNYAGPGTQSVVALFAPDGTLDPTFDGDGLLQLAYTDPRSSQARSLIVGADDKILVAGFLINSTPTTFDDFLLIRLLPNGSFDPTFAGGGEVHTDLGMDYDRAFAMTLAPNGAIVLAGYTTTNSRASAYTRYLNDISTGTSEIEAHAPSLVVFPNPASDHVWISAPRTNGASATVDLFALDGTHLLSHRMTGNASSTSSQQFNLPSHLTQGAYILEVRTRDGVQRTKLLVAQP